MTYPDLQAQVDAIPVGSFVFEPLGHRFVAANKHFCKLIGYTLEELKALPWPRIMPDDYVDPAERAIQQAAPDIATLWKWRRKDGGIVAASIRYQILTVPVDGNPSPVYFVTFARAGERAVSAKTFFQ